MNRYRHHSEGMGGFSYLWMNTGKNKWIQDCKVREFFSRGEKRGALFLKISPATWKAILWKADWHICFLIQQTQERIPFYCDKVTPEWRENWSNISGFRSYRHVWLSIGPQEYPGSPAPAQLPSPAESPPCSPLRRFRFPFADAILALWTESWRQQSLAADKRQGPLIFDVLGSRLSLFWFSRQT